MFEALANFFNTVIMILNNYGGLLAKGTGVTILLAIVGTGVGFLIGLLIGVYKTLPIRHVYQNFISLIANGDPHSYYPTIHHP